MQQPILSSILARRKPLIRIRPQLGRFPLDPKSSQQRPTTRTGDQVSDRLAPRPEPQPAPRKRWIAPAVVDLPRLENLTLQTGGTIPGDQSVYP